MVEPVKKAPSLGRAFTVPVKVHEWTGRMMPLRDALADCNVEDGTEAKISIAIGGTGIIVEFKNEGAFMVGLNSIFDAAIKARAAKVEADKPLEFKGGEHAGK